MLSNRRAYADLYSRLMMGDIEREKRLHTQWESRVLDWKRLHKEMAVADFRFLSAFILNYDENILCPNLEPHSKLIYHRYVNNVFLVSSLKTFLIIFLQASLFYKFENTILHCHSGYIFFYRITVLRNRTMTGKCNFLKTYVNYNSVYR